MNRRGFIGGLLAMVAAKALPAPKPQKLITDGVTEWIVVKVSYGPEFLGRFENREQMAWMWSPGD